MIAPEFCYRGPLDGAHVGPETWPCGRPLTDGSTETILVSATLPLSVGNDAKGAALSLRVAWVFEASPILP